MPPTSWKMGISSMPPPAAHGSGQRRLASAWELAVPRHRTGGAGAAYRHSDCRPPASAPCRMPQRSGSPTPAPAMTNMASPASTNMAHSRPDSGHSRVGSSDEDDAGAGAGTGEPATPGAAASPGLACSSARLLSAGGAAAAAAVPASSRSSRAARVRMVVQRGALQDHPAAGSMNHAAQAAAKTPSHTQTCPAVQHVPPTLPARGGSGGAAGGKVGCALRASSGLQAGTSVVLSGKRSRAQPELCFKQRPCGTRSVCRLPRLALARPQQFENAGKLLEPAWPVGHR